MGSPIFPIDEAKNVQGTEVGNEETGKKPGTSSEKVG